MGSNLSYHECLGSGASGDVYRVTWKSKEHGTIEAAAKKIKIEGEVSEQVKREIDLLKKLDHRNIIRYYDSFVEKSCVVILTEFAAKGSLYDYLKHASKLPENLLHLWIFHLARGIDFLKQNNVLHRDLKSPNCILTVDNVLKICDFGIAKYLSSTKTTKSAKGSAKWQAPEILKDLELSPKADIFAFGVIVWEMIKCEEPYKEMRQETVIYNVMVNDLRPKIPEDCPSFLKELMEKCWHKDREQRPESIEIIKLLLNEFRQELRKEFRHFTKKDVSALTDVLTEEDCGLEWKLKHELQLRGELCFVASDRLAICRYGRVEVHQVTREETQLLYTLTSHEWGDDVVPWDATVSESMPDSILVVCLGIPYLYQFPCHESTQHAKKYKIHYRDYGNEPCCITANANTAVIGVCKSVFDYVLVVCSLPQFTQQSIVRLSFIPLHLSITTDYLLVMGSKEMVIKPLGNMGQDLCRILPPDGCEFRSVSFRNDARQIYAACYRKDSKGVVYKYTWDGNGTPQYVNTGCVIDNLGELGYFRGLSVTTDGLLAVCDRSTKIFSLE